MTKIKLYKYLLANPISSQRKMAEELKISVGTINSLIKKGILEKEIEVNEISYREKEYLLTSKGKKRIPYSNIKTAVLLLGKIRNDKILFKKNIIKRNVEFLKELGINQIYIVGNQENKNELKKIKEIQVLINNKADKTGSMYSLSIVRNLIKKDFLLLDGDLTYEIECLKKMLITLEENVVLVGSEKRQNATSFIEERDGKLYRISKEKEQMSMVLGEMIGISKISFELYKELLKEFDRGQNNYFSYEYALQNVCDKVFIKCLYLPKLFWKEIY